MMKLLLSGFQLQLHKWSWCSFLSYLQKGQDMGHKLSKELSHRERKQKVNQKKEKTYHEQTAETA